MADNNIISLFLFGKEIGRIGFNEQENKSSFQYNPEFLKESTLLNLFPQTGIIKRISQTQVFRELEFNNLRIKRIINSYIPEP